MLSIILSHSSSAGLFSFSVCSHCSASSAELLIRGVVLQGALDSRMEWITAAAGHTTAKLFTPRSGMNRFRKNSALPSSSLDCITAVQSVGPSCYWGKSMVHESDGAGQHAKHTSKAPHLKRASGPTTRPAALRANPQAGGSTCTPLTQSRSCSSPHSNP